MVFLRHLYIKCIFLPSQARDKQRENSKTEWRSDPKATGEPAHWSMVGTVRQRVFFCGVFLYKT